MTCWNPSVELAGRDELSAMQSERLKKAVARAYTHVAPYRAKMDAAGVAPEDIQSIDDIVKLPVTQKTDLRDNYPFGLFAVPLGDVIRIHASSGTTGKKTVVGYTRADIDIWNECMARSLAMAGVTKDDILHVSYGYGLFTGGLGGHYGGETMGCATIPVSSGNTAQQLQIMQDFGSTVLLCTPSYAMFLGDAIREAGVLDQIKLRIGVFGAEPWTENMRTEIESRLRLSAFDIYGLSEISGPGVANECPCKCGLHIQEDHFYPEILDPDTGLPVPDGTPGELVFSCITKEAMPLLRYNTRDITSITRETCACGRSLTRMRKPTGRTDDMLIIRGVNVFPSQVESVLLGMGEVAPYYMLIVDRKNNLDTLEIQVEMTDSFFSDEVRVLEATEKRIARGIESTLGLSAKITLVAPGAVQRFEGKAKRVIDNRKLI